MLRWRLFGISFCIEPSFWLMNALWAMFMAGALTGHQAHDRLLLVFILVWIFCTLISVMVHELGHVVTGRIFGQPGNITISGFGGQAVGGYDQLRPWQRIIVIFMGPCAGFIFVAFLLHVDSTAWDGLMDYFMTVTRSRWWDDYKIRSFWIDHTPLGAWRRDMYFPYVVTINILTFINLFVNILNLLPIIPMDGGMIKKEIFCLISPRGGLKVAFGTSLAMALVMTAIYLDLTLERYNVLDKRLEPYYPFGFPEFSLIVFLSLAYQCWQAYRMLAAAERHEMYKQFQED